MKNFEKLWLKVNKLALWLLDFILPRSKRARELALMSPEDFMRKAKTSAALPIPEARALFSYKDPLVKDAIWLLKYKQDKKAAEILGAILGNISAEWLEDLELFENFNKPIVIPVPMGKNRRRERGQNHSESLCREIMKVMPRGVAIYQPLALFKIQETESQAHTKNRAERLQNLSGSFSADSNIVRGKNIILVDDVITTGATAEEVRKTLLHSGAKKVIVIAAAH